MILRNIFIFIAIFFISFNGRATVLSTNSEFSLLTCSEGTDVYSLFGHTAIRVKNKQTGQDAVFNYGLFDFNTKNFIWKFVKGETFYMLGVQTYESFLFSYKIEERSVWEQKLYLNEVQKTTLINLLANDYKPENRTYLYNFLYNNCATKVRDNLETTLAINSYIDKDTAETFREILMPYLKDAQWTRLGINLALGQPLEQTISKREKLFLPLELMEVYEDLNYESTALYEAEKKAQKKNILTPTFVFAMLIFLLFIRLIKTFKAGKWLLITTLFISGIGGLILTFISFFSIHPAVFPNFNLLILQPINLVLAIYFIFKKRNVVLLKSLNVYYVLSILVLLLVKQQTSIDIILLSVSFLLLFISEYKIAIKERAA